MGIMIGGDALAKWANTQVVDPIQRRRFDSNIPTVKFVVGEDGQIYATEYDSRSSLQHPGIIAAAGITLTSTILAGFGKIPRVDAIDVEIKTGTEDLYRQVRQSIGRRPEIVDELKQNLLGSFQTVLIRNLM